MNRNGSKKEKASGNEERRSSEIRKKRNILTREKKE